MYQQQSPKYNLLESILTSGLENQNNFVESCQYVCIFLSTDQNQISSLGLSLFRPGSLSCSPLGKPSIWYVSSLWSCHIVPQNFPGCPWTLVLNFVSAPSVSFCLVIAALQHSSGQFYLLLWLSVAVLKCFDLRIHIRSWSSWDPHRWCVLRLLIFTIPKIKMETL